MVRRKTVINRREIIASIGTAATLGLAGCSSSNGGSNDTAASETTGDTGNGEGDETESSVDYPTEEVEIIVPYATGGGFDAYARLTAPYLEKHLPNDVTVTVKNVVGGGGVKGTTETYNADPDGHTLMIWDAYQGVTQQIGRNVGYQLQEMSHIGAVTQSPNSLISMESAGISGWDDFVNRIDELNFATQGVGAISHTGVVLLGELTGAWAEEDVNFVHYGGTGEALSGLERGEADVFLVGPATSGLKVVKALNSEMTIMFSDPVGEDSIYHGVPKQYSGDLDIENMDQYARLTRFRRFFTGPPGVPEEILEIQRNAFSKIIQDEEFLQETSEKGRPIVNPGSADQVSEVMGEQFETFGSSPMKGIIQGVF
ncbi:tripartite tricarboxylate transporter substrate binding protein [Halobellus sp. Atlit-38R]|uniref:Bug family tripartite tricarboxylate transporter substrate binding protein n=1 Tax=Halobellus sp. Atlit-38R TaxID=2282131 RepID=UPI0013140E04|nr:tripartite tricarboxylate transporter substrate-binding protein [Halobellus sp. Atlit-38R]